MCRKTKEFRYAATRGRPQGRKGKSMKIIFYGTRDYDHLYFDVLAADPDYGCTIKFLAANLDPDTAQLAAGGDAVCAFVNSDCGAETLSVLAKAGIKLLLMRCAGYNNVDLAAAKANGITVMRVPGYSPEAVAEHAMALAQAANRRICKAYIKVRNNNFALDGLLGQNFYGACAGIVGTGRIGAAMARICHGFGMNVLCYDMYKNPEVEKFARYVSLEELLQKADLVSLHCPLTEGTHHMINKDKTFWAVIIPVVILFFAFNTLPMIKGVIYSFTNYKGYGTYDYVGFRNYADLFTDSRVGKSYLFTFKYALAGTILVNVLSLIMAVGLNSKIRCKSALRGIYFVPNILGGLVIGYIFSFIFTYILPTVGNVFHIGFLQNSILASEKYAWIGVLIVGVWQAVAMNTIIYISGLQTVPEEVYEASMLDGASKWKQFWKVTFPLVMPFVTINLVLSTKNFLMVFDQIMSLTKGGPAQSTESISYLIYKNGMDGGQFGFQSANAVIFFIVIVAISLFQMTVMNKKEEQL